MNIQIYVR